jgi:hypothetical protein
MHAAAIYNDALEDFLKKNRNSGGFFVWIFWYLIHKVVGSKFGTAVLSVVNL